MSTTIFLLSFRFYTLCFDVIQLCLIKNVASFTSGKRLAPGPHLATEIVNVRKSKRHVVSKFNKVPL